jgi:hypothetical protein
MTTIVPPLKIFNYSPVSPDNSSPGIAAPNNSFFNSTNSLYTIPISIANNTVPTSFDKNSFIHSYNTSSEYYLTNNNNVLSNPIGNYIGKGLNIKLNTQSIYNYKNGLGIIIIYNSNFYYGTIIASSSKMYKTSLNSNGTAISGIYLDNIIYSDGYYAYLTNNVTTYSTLTVEIIDGVRIVTIPPDPTGKYELVDVIAKYNMINLCFYNNISSNYISNNNNVINDYYLNAILAQDVDITLPVGNYLSNYINKFNINNTSNFDGMQLQIFSIPKTSQILKQGNIFGLLVSYNKPITNTGTNIKTERPSYGVILYADGDFKYLNNKGVQLYPYIQLIDNNTGTKILDIPTVPADYVIPQTKVSPNITVGGVTTYYTFYYEKLNNANVYNPNYNTQSYTLGTSNMYDSYDFINNIPGNIIGSVVAYKITTISKIGVQTTATITSYNFNNSSILLTAVVDNYSLTNIGDLISNVKQDQNIISHSIDYDLAYNGVYNITVNSGVMVNTVFVNSLIN